MRVLMITDNYCLEEVDGVYYHRCIDEHINAYYSLGKITLALPVLHKISYNRIVDLSLVDICPIDKENTIYKRFFNRKNNRSIIDAAVRDTDLVIGFVPSSVCDLALKSARKHNKRFLAVVISSAWDILWNHSLGGKLMAPISHFLTSRTIRNSDYVIYVTERYLQGKYPTNGKGIGISDAVVPEVSEAILEKRLSRIKESRYNKFHIATIGAIDVKYKAQDDVIKAIAILASEGYDIDYTLIGGGSKERLIRVASEYGISHNKLHFMGAVPHEKISEFLDTFDLYIQPSRTEGLPRSVVEAMSRGLPVICSEVGGMPELVDHDCIFLPGDICSLVEIIKSITSSNQRQVEISTRNYKMAKNFYKDVLDLKRVTFLEQIKESLK